MASRPGENQTEMDPEEFDRTNLWFLVTDDSLSDAEILLQTMFQLALQEDKNAWLVPLGKVRGDLSMVRAAHDAFFDMNLALAAPGQREIDETVRLAGLLAEDAAKTKTVQAIAKLVGDFSGLIRRVLA